MRRPEGMTERTWATVERMTEDRRDRVLERAALMFYGGAASTWAEADEMALAAEGIATQQSIESLAVTRRHAASRTEQQTIEGA